MLDQPKDPQSSKAENPFNPWLKQTAKVHGFVHLADEDCQSYTTNQIPGCRIVGSCF